MDKTNCKNIIARMRTIVKVKTDVALAEKLGDAKKGVHHINAFKRRGDISFYYKIIEFGIKHNISINYIVNGMGPISIDVGKYDVDKINRFVFDCSETEHQYLCIALKILCCKCNLCANAIKSMLTAMSEHVN